MSDLVFDKNRTKKFLIIFLGIILGVFIFFKSLNYIAPFLIAFILSVIMEPVIKFLVTKLKFPRSIASIIGVILILVILILIISFIVAKIVSEARDLFIILPGIFSNVYNDVINLSESSNKLISGLPSEVISFLSEFLGNIVTYAGEIVNTVVKQIFNTAFLLPSMLIFFLITTISTYFMLSDKQKFNIFIKKQLPYSWYNKINYIKTDIFSSIVKLIRAYIIIMTITFTELLLGFTLMNVKYALLLAAIIAVLDILPVLGTGGVVIPWAIYSLVTNNFKLGLSLLVLYVIILVVRQVIEPKIIGTQIGVHPLLTLTAMYVGLKLLGAVGLIMGPITFLVIKSILSIVFKGQSLKELIFAQE
ncbi:MAG: sporulation integral membrane protein YtvI [Eubacteriales bacterium]